MPQFGHAWAVVASESGDCNLSPQCGQVYATTLRQRIVRRIVKSTLVFPCESAAIRRWRWRESYPKRGVITWPASVAERAADKSASLSRRVSDMGGIP